MISKRYIRIIYSSLSGVLLALPWTEWNLGWVLLFAFVPLLMVEEWYFQNRQNYKSVQVFFHSYWAFLVWNGITTWWIWYATSFGAVAAIILNASFYAGIFWLFHIFKRNTNRNIGNIGLIFFWLGFEFIYLHGEISWTWLILGNGFSHNTEMIQWYEYTGALGGSLWVLLANILIINTINSFVLDREKRLKIYNLIGIGIILFLPVIISVWIYTHYTETNHPKSVVVVQPNIDPYHEKFSGMTDEQQLQIFLDLADSLITDSTEFVIGPETAIPGGIWEGEVNNYITIDRLKKFVKEHPQINIVMGASTYKLYTTPSEVTPTARRYGDDVDNLYYDAFNTALMLNASDSISFYHKSVLVIGVEKIPYPELLKPLEDFAINLGGTTGSLGTQKERTVFRAYPDKTGVAPIICYESIYGEFVSKFVRNGAELIFVLTNDGWWEDTPGYRQHLSYSQLRAIETRRDIARSANTGISAIINQRGDILQKTGWWVRTAFRGTINTNKEITFYVRFGDYIGRIAAFFSILLLLLLITQWVKRNSKLRNLQDKIMQDELNN